MHEEKAKHENRDGISLGNLSPSRFCPRCGSASMIYQEGCRVCRNCGHSTCS
jgi:ribonucleoside-diphosphate reductase alpha chain